MSFDAKRTGTGTEEWADKTENICRGCRNNCRYCYAAHMGNRFKTRLRGEWEHEVLTKRAEITSYPARDGVVMFPSSHDITPGNLGAYVRVAKLILAKGNKLLIVSKPRLGCISALIEELSDLRDQILFRFTIGTTNPELAIFWEPGAPPPKERIDCLQMAVAAGFKTSVSIEPMLAGYDGAVAVIEAVKPFVTETIWIGKMNQLKARVSPEAGGREAIGIIEHQQRNSEVLRLWSEYREDPVIRWKDSIQTVIEKYQQSNVEG